MKYFCLHTKNKNGSIKSPKILSTLLSFILVFSLCSCGKSNPSNALLGKWTTSWESNYSVHHRSYEFFPDGTVKITKEDYPDDVGTYSIVDEERVKISISTVNTKIMDYSISGNVLTLDGDEYIKE